MEMKTAYSTALILVPQHVPQAKAWILNAIMVMNVYMELILATLQVHIVSTQMRVTDVIASLVMREALMTNCVLTLMSVQGKPILVMILIHIALIQLEIIHVHVRMGMKGEPIINFANALHLNLENIVLSSEIQVII